MISILKSRNFLVYVIMSDGEGAIGKMRLDLMALGVEVDVSAAGGHVVRIERRMQMVKERARAHICGRLPFTLNELGNTYLALYCVSRINCQQSGSRPGGLSPKELFSGSRVDGTLDFGDYAVCTVSNTDNTMTSRTEDYCHATYTQQDGIIQDAFTLHRQDRYKGSIQDTVDATVSHRDTECHGSQRREENHPS